jgi:hypothetical protein
MESAKKKSERYGPLTRSLNGYDEPIAAVGLVHFLEQRQERCRDRHRARRVGLRALARLALACRLADVHDGVREVDVRPAERALFSVAQPEVDRDCGVALPARRHLVVRHERRELRGIQKLLREPRPTALGRHDVAKGVRVEAAKARRGLRVRRVPHHPPDRSPDVARRLVAHLPGRDLLVERLHERIAMRARQAQDRHVPDDGKNVHFEVAPVVGGGALRSLGEPADGVFCDRLALTVLRGCARDGRQSAGGLCFRASRSCSGIFASSACQLVRVPSPRVHRACQHHWRVFGLRLQSTVPAFLRLIAA